MIRRAATLLALPLACALAAGCAGATGAAGAASSKTTSQGQTKSGAATASSASSKVRRYQGTGGIKTVSIQSGAQRRTYLLYVPPGDATNHPLPLVLIFHGAGDTASNTVSETDLPALAQQHRNMILVYPQGYQDTWNEGTGDTPAAQAKVNDVAFVAAILRRIESHYAVNRRRVVATGFSNGALLTEYLGCALSQQLTMIAPVEGELPQTISAHCRPAAPVSVFEVHGTADKAIPYDGGAFTGVGGIPGPTVLSAPDSAQRWAALDHCAGSPKSKTSGKVTFATYSGCRDAVSVTLATVSGGQHDWPSGYGPTLMGVINAMSSDRIASP